MAFQNAITFFHLKIDPFGLRYLLEILKDRHSRNAVFPSLSENTFKHDIKYKDGKLYTKIEQDYRLGFKDRAKLGF